MSAAADRITEFLRQSNLRRGIDLEELYTVSTDPNADPATLRASDLRVVLDQLSGAREYMTKLVADCRKRGTELADRSHEDRRLGWQTQASIADAVAREVREIADLVETEIPR